MTPDHAQILVRKTCRACTGDLIEVLYLGNLKLNAFPKEQWELDQLQSVRLVLMVCKECGLVQLDRTVPPDWLYRTYWYRSGVNESMVRELQNVVEEAVALVPVGEGDVVVDIGANDGTLLKHYHKIGRRPHRIAIEPARNLTERLSQHAETVIPDYFPAVPKLSEKARIVTAIAMCYDLEDPLAFFTGIRDLLAPDGIAVVQFQDFGEQLRTAAFDNICHEHLEYYTLWSLSHILRRAGLSIQRAHRTPINGGSLRVFLRWLGHPVAPEQSVADQLIWEARRGLDTPTIRDGNLGAFTLFRDRVVTAREQVTAALHQAFLDQLTVDVYGASTKGNILLQVLGLGPGRIRHAIDRSPEKEGHLTVTGIPIVGEEVGRKWPADLWLCPIWQFRESVLTREAWYLQQGGTILFPLPTCEVVRKSWRIE